ncbi:MAG: ABC-F family ATP-binding cassette domain-containing protein, partial [Alphaproteobacteria bacterium]|nr:ABC-F family ATP-binding cassette domain-containing protein [Alphaproteobacteria bacterium]
ELDADASPLDHLARRLPDKRESQVRAHLGGFGFGVEKADTRVRDLSGGEKARLLFALMSLDAPHVLLLDEPSNHLDVDARQALVEALNAYQGAVILVSHDPHLIELVADRLWLVADGTCRAYDGDLGDYRRLLRDQARVGRGGARGGALGGDDAQGAEDRKAQRRNRAE